MAAADDVATGPAEDPRVLRTRRDIQQTALRIVLQEGSEALTHPHLARVAGYSKSTLYKHWPTRTKLLVAAFSDLAQMPHSRPTGDLRSDLINELMTFRTAMAEHQLHRTLMVLAELTASHPELQQVLDAIVADGERVITELLQEVVAGEELEAAKLMLGGSVLYRAMLHGEPPSDAVIAAAVDLTLRAVGVS